MRNERGSSWIEVLIVVAVIGIIVSIAIPSLVRARDDERKRNDFPKYFGVKPPSPVLDDAQKSVLKPLVKRRIGEFSEQAERDRVALSNLFKEIPAVADEAQKRLDAVTQAEATVKFSEEQYQRARESAEYYGLLERPATGGPVG